ncbi:MAG: DUF421 domain-containing protein [Archangium gephyra]|uniref:DUF421 domain-containing protein n=1 Tax=Archangium gephyra TaxID=48 RepID=A0A2W5T3G8_9BACT|nr:MAG: DUF421 domain-containing protein [Archangium gephyra]
MYWALFLLFRLVLRRDVGAVGMSDFLFVVLVGDATQNAMSGDHYGVADGLVVVGTLATWNQLTDVLSYHVPFIEKLMKPRRLLLFAHGQLNRRNMRREFITMDELRTKLHEEGLKDFNEAERIWLESNGELAVIKKG